MSFRNPNVPWSQLERHLSDDPLGRGPWIEPAPGEGAWERDSRYQIQKRSTAKGRPTLTAFGKEYDPAAGMGAICSTCHTSTVQIGQNKIV